MNELYKLESGYFKPIKKDDGTIEFSALKTNKYKGGRYGNWEITKQTLSEALKNLKSKVTGYLISAYEVLKSDGTPHGGQTKSLAIVKDGYIRDNELIVKLQPVNETAEEKLLSGEYQYVSPDLHPNYMDKIEGKKKGNTMVGLCLTSNPFQPNLTPSYALNDIDLNNYTYLSEIKKEDNMASEEKAIVEEVVEEVALSEEVVEEVKEDNELKVLADEKLALEENVKCLSEEIKTLSEKLETVETEKKELSEKLETIESEKALAEKESFFKDNAKKVLPKEMESMKKLWEVDKETVIELVSSRDELKELQEFTGENKVDSKIDEKVLGTKADPKIIKRMEETNEDFYKAFVSVYPKGL